MEVFVCRLPAVKSQETINRYVDYLPPVKREQIKRYRSMEDRYRTLVSYLLLRKVLMNKLSSVDLTMLRFTTYGKPFADSSRIPPFSLSHSGDWCVCAIGTEGMIGVDIEKMTKRQPELFPLLFRKEEECKSDSAFFTRWTIKESYLKAIGTGLMVDLQTLIVEEGAMGEYRVKHQQQYYPRGKVKVFNLLKQYCLSLCTLQEVKLPAHLQLYTFEELIEPSV